MKFSISCLMVVLSMVMTACTPVDHNTGKVEPLVSPDAGPSCSTDWECAAGFICQDADCIPSCSSPIAFSATSTSTPGLVVVPDAGIAMGTVFENRVGVDVNLDGLLDVIATPSVGDGFIYYFEGKGDGTFEAEVPMPGPAEKTLFAQSGDFNADSLTDLIVATSTEVALFGFSPVPTTTVRMKTLFTGNVLSVAAADFTGSSRLDLLVLKDDGKKMVLFEQDSNGNFSQVVEWTLTDKVASLLATDLNQDGRNELVVSQNLKNSIAVFMNSASGLSTTPESYTTPASPDFLNAVDLDGDQDLDLVYGSRGTTAVVTMKNDGQGNLAAAVRHVGPVSIHGLEVTDINRDSRPDIVTISVSSTVAPMPGISLSSLMAYAMLGDGLGGFSTQPTMLTLPMTNFVMNAQGIVLADFNRDGNVDLLANSFMAGNSFLPGACR